MLHLNIFICWDGFICIWCRVMDQLGAGAVGRRTSAGWVWFRLSGFEGNADDKHGWQVVLMCGLTDWPKNVWQSTAWRWQHVLLLSTGPPSVSWGTQHFLKAGPKGGREMQLLVNRDSPLLQIYPGSRNYSLQGSWSCVCGSHMGWIIVTVPLKLIRLHWSCQAVVGLLFYPPPGHLWVAVSAGCCPLTHSRWPSLALGQKSRKASALSF